MAKSAKGAPAAKRPKVSKSTTAATSAGATKSSLNILQSDSDSDSVIESSSGDSQSHGDLRTFIDSEAEETNDEDDGVGSDGGDMDKEDVDMDAPGMDLRVSRRKLGRDRIEGGSKRTERREALYPPYQPPPSFTPMPLPDIPSVSFASSPFEWDNLNKLGKGCEVWCVRVPASFKASRLSTLQLRSSALNSAKPHTSTPLGTLTTTKRNYTLRLASSTPSRASSSTHGQGLTQDADPTLEAEEANKEGEREVTEVGVKADTHNGVGAGGGEEMGGLRLMVPRVGGEGKGRLFVAPKSITRHLILTPDISPVLHTAPTTSDPTLSTSLVPGFDDLVPSIAHEDDALTGVPESDSKAKKRKRAQPMELVMRNVPFGGLVSVKREGANVTVEEGRGGSPAGASGKDASRQGTKAAITLAGLSQPAKKKSRKSQA